MSLARYSLAASSQPDYCHTQPLLSPQASSSPFAAAQTKRERNLNLSASKPPRKAQGISRLERSISSISSPAYTPSRLRPNQDAIRTPVTHSIRKHRGLKAAEERALATELEHSALSTASDNVQVSQTFAHVCCCVVAVAFTDAYSALQVIVRIRPTNDRENFIGTQL